jgi:orotidine-5'-phosphate decarboxylase
MNKKNQEIIEMLFKLGIVGTNFKQPIAFKSGLKSPIYFDFRKCTTSPDLLKLIAESFKEKFSNEKIEVIVGVATSAISHATVLSIVTGLPSSYIRPDATAKNYGTGNMIEGASVKGKTVLLVEDLVSTSGSLIENEKVLVAAGAKKVINTSIFTYGFAIAEHALAKAQITLESMLTINDTLPYLRNQLSVDDYKSLMQWIRSPHTWFEKNKFTFEFGYLNTLREHNRNTGSIVCMGLDMPDMKALPTHYSKHGPAGWSHYIQDVVAEMTSRGILPAAFKPNESCYMVHNKPLKGVFTGYNVLADMVKIAKKSGVPVIMDSKRGDIGPTSGFYANAYLDKDGWDANAMTVHGYMGDDSISPFTEYCNHQSAKGVYVLGITSNKGSNDFQKQKMQTGKFLYEETIQKVIGWANKRPGLGLVLGATHPDELLNSLTMVAGKSIPVLIPGVGAQGATGKDIAEIIKSSGIERSMVLVNSSSGITHPWVKKNTEYNVPSYTECVELCVNNFIALNKELS